MPSQCQLYVVGLVGGIASGKSRVARHFRELGAAVLDADRTGHEVLLDPDVKRQLRQRWGDRILTPAGEIDRQRVAETVFAPEDHDRRNLEFLESVVHPEIGKRLTMQLAEARQQGNRVAILDAPVMFKAGWERFCDEVLFVEANQTVRLERALARGWTPEMLRRREASQTPLEVKRRKSTCEVDNSGDWQSTARALDALWHQWLSRRCNE